MEDLYHSMVALIKFIASISIWLYLVLAVVVVILLRTIQLALRERSQTIFELERNHATARLNRALFYLLLVILVGGGIFYTSTELIAEVPLPEETPTPTVVAQLPPTPTSPPLLPTPTPTLTATSRPTISTGQLATPPTPTSQAQAGVSPNCPLPGAHITQPGNGAVVSGVVQVIGTANIENFDYYKIEFRVPGSDEWHYINSYKTRAGEGPIARWDTTGLPAGEYEFRLVVVDTTGNFPEPCQIRLIVQH
jgi:hypothetical protein